jgi:hypothetical protein
MMKDEGWFIHARLNEPLEPVESLKQADFLDNTTVA